MTKYNIANSAILSSISSKIDVNLFDILINHFESSEINKADFKVLQAFGLNSKIIEKIKNFDLEKIKILDFWLEKDSKNQLITILDNEYPEQLKNIDDPPLVLYISGNIEALKMPQIAIVGSRKASMSAIMFAEELAKNCSEAGLVTTSGLAIGIDTACHKGTLKTGRITNAVFGNGPDIVYPRCNRTLLEQILTNHGCIISEFLPGTQPNRENFPKRNRIISGISLCVVVVEAAIKSGSLITARNAAEQGKEVFAVPGSVNNPRVSGCHYLIKNGAKLLENINDVIDSLKFNPILEKQLNELLKDKKINTIPFNQDKTKNLSINCKKVLECISYETTSLDWIVEKSGLNCELAMSAIAELELLDIIVPSERGYFLYKLG